MKTLRDIANQVHRSEADARARRHIMSAADHLSASRHEQAIDALVDAIAILRTAQRQAVALEMKEARS